MRNNIIKPYSNILAARICSLFCLILVLLQSVQVFSIVFKSEFTFARRVFVESTLPAWAFAVTLMYLSSEEVQSALSWKKSLISIVLILAMSAVIRFVFPVWVFYMAIILVPFNWLVFIVTIFVIFVKIYKTKSTQI